MIFTLRKFGFNQSEISQELGRHRSSISRELRGNRHPTDGRYRPGLAAGMARDRRKRARRGSQFSEGQPRRVEMKLHKQRSPEQISGRFRLTGELSINHETIYRYVIQDNKEGGELYKHLYGSRDEETSIARGRLSGNRLATSCCVYRSSPNSRAHTKCDSANFGDCQTLQITPNTRARSRHETGLPYTTRLRSSKPRRDGSPDAVSIRTMSMH